MVISLSKTSSERGTLTKKDIDDIARLIQGFLKSKVAPKEDYNFALGHARDGSVIIGIVKQNDGLNQGFEVEILNVLKLVGDAINHPIKEALKVNIVKTFVPAFQKTYGSKEVSDDSKGVKMFKLSKNLIPDIKREVAKRLVENLSNAPYARKVNAINNDFLANLYFVEGKSDWQDIEFIFNFVQNFVEVDSMESAGITEAYDTVLKNHNLKLVGVSKRLRKLIIQNIKVRASNPDESLETLNEFAVR